MFTNCGEDSEDPVADVGPFTGSIGDTYQGGIVFYLDGNGGGLIAATEDRTSEYVEDGAAWGCSNGTEISGADGTAIGTGAQNNLDILAGCSEDGIAAKLAADYEVTVDGVTYDDWFLPSNDELKKICENIGPGNMLGLGNVGGFIEGLYWSSTEYNRNWSTTEVPFVFAWYHNFKIDCNQFYILKNSLIRVRSVRTFN